jgi:hypothetical protein
MKNYEDFPAQIRTNLYCHMNIMYASYQQDMEKFLCDLGESIKSDMVLVYSTHPGDILNASSHAQFTSCHRMDGEYSCSPFGYLNTPTMLTTYTCTKKEFDEAQAMNDLEHVPYFIGRAWMAINPTRNVEKFCMGHMGSYGTFHRDARKQLRNYMIKNHLQHFLDEPIEYNEDKHSQLDTTTPYGHTYVDGFSTLHCTDSFEGITLKIRTPTCPICGESNEYTEIAQCQDCDTRDEDDDYDG